jgi:hypothetical protein
MRISLIGLTQAVDGILGPLLSSSTFQLIFSHASLCGISDYEVIKSIGQVGIP